MSAIARYVVDAVVVERRSPSQVARESGISKRWIFELLKRFREGGYAALEPRSRAAHRSPNQRALTLDPDRDYQPMGGRWPVHNGAQHGCTVP